MPESGWGEPNPWAGSPPTSATEHPLTTSPPSAQVLWTTPQPPYVWPFGPGPDVGADPGAWATPDPSRIQPGWGPPQTSWTPPRRRRPLPYVIAALVLVVGLAFGGLAVASTVTGDGLAYRNEGYVPPDPDPNPPQLPTPPNAAAARTLTTANPLYQQRMTSPIRCELGTLTAGASQDELAQRANGLTACLMRGWIGPVEAAGFDLYRPSVTVISTKTDSPCGDLTVDNAFYCAGDQQIYLGTKLVSRFATNPIVVDMIIAHEFGHLVQARTTILTSARAIQQGAANDVRLQLNRRIELQADCFAGLWLHAVTRSMGWGSADRAVFVAAVEDAGDRPDKPGDHGVGGSRAYWLQRGLDTTDIASCNTFTAASDRVR